MMPMPMLRLLRPRQLAPAAETGEEAERSERANAAGECREGGDHAIAHDRDAKHHPAPEAITANAEADRSHGVAEEEYRADRSAQNIGREMELRRNQRKGKRINGDDISIEESSERRGKGHRPSDGA
jgi:hypothetical protein